ncbi:serine/threonine protein kinase, partial [Myxococcota bacterium]|nr:serine/threonine protein kinase [Myxococcota bacterium]
MPDAPSQSADLPVDGALWARFAPGAVVAGRYRLIGPLGAGAFGRVFEAEDLLTRQRVALKVLHEHTPADAQRVERAALRGHGVRGVVRLLGSFEAEGHAVLVLERAEGTPFPGSERGGGWALLAGPVAALLQVLGALHARDIVHLDLKPANVLVSASGGVTVLDLGLASGPGASLVGAWSARGLTPAYAAPEQLLGRDVAPCTDLFAVAVMLYELLTGQLPHGEDGAAGLRARRIRDNPTPINTLCPELPAPVAEGIMAALARRKEHRTQTAWAMMDSLGLTERGPFHAERCAGRLSLDALRALIAGPSLLMHLPEDAAAELMRRTDGDPALVEEELRRWTRAGLAWWDGDKLVISRADLNRVRCGDGADGPMAPAEVSQDADLVLACLNRAAPFGTRTALLSALGWEDARLKPALEELVQADALVLLSSGVLRPTRSARVELDEAKWAALSRALTRGTEPRRRLVAAGQDAREVAASALLEAQESLRDGQTADCAATARFALHVVRISNDPELRPLEAQALSLLATVALAEMAARPIEQALYEHERGAFTAPLSSETLLRAAAAALRGDAEAGFEGALALGPLEDRLLGERRLGVLMYAASHSRDPAQMARVIEEAHAWAAQGDEDSRARVQRLLGQAAYREGRYADALRAHRAALAPSVAVTVQLGALCGAASAALELGALDEVSELARRVIRSAEDRRLHLYEARGRWLLREAHCRGGERVAPERALIEAARTLEDLVNLSLILFTEARLAARVGRADEGLV